MRNLEIIKQQTESQGGKGPNTYSCNPSSSPPESPHLAKGTGHGRVHLNADEGVVSVRGEVGVVGGESVGDDQVGLSLLLALRLLVPLLLDKRGRKSFSKSINHLLMSGNICAQLAHVSRTCTARQPDNYGPDCGEIW